MRPYKTAHTEAKTERIINRSRFISQCFPVRSEDEALSRLNEVRKQYPDATHVCYAYRIGELSETTRFSDAGEPSGTAGMPILEADLCALHSNALLRRNTVRRGRTCARIFIGRGRRR